MYEPNCNRAGEEPGAEGRVPSWWGKGDSDEKVECDCCHVDFDEDELTDFYVTKKATRTYRVEARLCQNCVDKSVAEAQIEDVMRWGKTQSIDVKINFVLANAFTDEQINEILERELSASVAVLGESVWRSSIEENPQDYVEWTYQEPYNK